MVAPSRERPLVEVGRAKLSKSGQITIPANVRRELNLSVGDTVVYRREKDGQISIRKPRGATELAGIARKLPDGINVTDVIEELDQTPIVRARYKGLPEDADID